MDRRHPATSSFDNLSLLLFVIRGILLLYSGFCMTQPANKIIEIEIHLEFSPLGDIAKRVYLCQIY